MYKVVIGLEVHCELETESKNFSTAKNTFSENHNENVMPVDLGLPGILPVLNKEATRKSLKMAMALNCTNPDEVIFDRKNYFYPDLPKGYQITQVTKPMGINGYVDFLVNGEEKRALIHQIHLEEDTASLEHFSKFSLLDYNRAGIPLIEIVTEPCLSNADEAVAFLETVRQMILYCEVSEADSKKGQMRCDVNVSLMKEDAIKLGTKVEMKNINAFSTVRSSIEYEIKRQTALLENGEKVLQETRRYSEEDSKTYAMREKVDAVDYKYFIEPNIPPVKLTEEYLAEIKREVPTLALIRFKKYIRDYDLSEYDAKVLTSGREISDYYDEVITSGIDPKSAANWVSTLVLGSLNKLDISLSEFPITSEMLSGVLKLVEEDRLSKLHAKNIIYEAISEKRDPLLIIKERDLKQIDNTDDLLKIIKELMEEYPTKVADYIAGKDYIANNFIGGVMQKTNKQANPKVALKLIKEELERRKENANK